MKAGRSTTDCHRELKDENYGVELLNAIGRAYDAKAAQHMASSQFAPLGWFHGAKTTFNTVSDTSVDLLGLYLIC